ncbi:MAG: hypothetical protein RR201_03355, partial [Malacoplasma sp.]
MLLGVIMVVKKGLKYSFSVFGSAPKSCYENVNVNVKIKCRFLTITFVGFWQLNYYSRKFNYCFLFS